MRLSPKRNERRTLRERQGGAHLLLSMAQRGSPRLLNLSDTRKVLQKEGAPRPVLDCCKTCDARAPFCKGNCYNAALPQSHRLHLDSKKKNIRPMLRNVRSGHVPTVL